VAGETFVVPTRNVEGQVQRPTKGQGDKQSENSPNRVVEVLGIPTNAGLCFRHKHFVTFKRPRVGVVAAVAVFPRKIGHQKKRMENKTNRVIEPLVIAESVVATLVRYDPNAGEDGALDYPVEGPGEEGEVVGKGREVVQGQVEQR